jgi:predicted molibdopterin-dependent oxidoreductase YjgC
VVQDVRVTELAQSADVVLAGATFAEKAGCYVNRQGRLQYTSAPLPPRDGSMPDLDIIAVLANRGPGPISSRTVLTEAAGVIPELAPARSGDVPVVGIDLVNPHAPAPTAVPFADPWLAPRGRQKNLVEPKEHAGRKEDKKETVEI